VALLLYRKASGWELRKVYRSQQAQSPSACYMYDERPLRPALERVTASLPEPPALQGGSDASVETWYVRYEATAHIYQNAFKFVDRDGEQLPAYDLMNQDENVTNKLHSLMESLVYGRARASVDCETTWTLPFGPHHMSGL
jgi:hypothetical protein